MRNYGICETCGDNEICPNNNRGVNMVGCNLHTDNRVNKYSRNDVMFAISELDDFLESLHGVVIDAYEMSERLGEIQHWVTNNARKVL